MLELRDDAISGYRIIKPLGQGGMATVYLALQQNLRREVALKVMAPQLAQGEGFAERFLAEAQMTARLTHPNIMIVHDVGQCGPHYYIATELLPGGTLKERAPLLESLVDQLRVLRGIARGLGYAHQHRVIHRDIKPVNIMFRDEVQPVITDFGIAKALDATRVMTVAGTVIGTPHYMSPEQAQGLPLDGRSDLYSLGIMAYELLTGRVPFEAPEPLAVLMMHLQQPVPPLPPALAAVQPIIDRLLAKSPEHRYPTAEALVEALTPLLGKAPTGRISPVGDHHTRLHQVAPGPVVAAQPLPPRGHDITPVTAEQVQPPPAAAAPVPAPAKPRAPIAPLHISGYTEGPDHTAHFPRRVTPWQRYRTGWVSLAVVTGLATVASTRPLWAPATPVPTTGTASATAPAADSVPVLASLRAQVQARIDSGALFAPAGDNAHERLQLLLAQYPTDAGVLALWRSLGSAAALAVRQQFDRGERTAALALLRTAREQLRNDPSLAALQADLQTALDAEPTVPTSVAPEAEQPVAILLARADALYEDSRLVHPPGDNAVELYQAVLRRDPGNTRAQAALARIARHYLDVANTFRDRKRPDQALLQARNGLKAAPADADLLRVERELRVAQP